MEEFGMIKDMKEKELVKSLYKVIEGKASKITNEVFKEHMLLILQIGIEKNTYSDSEIQRRFKVFKINKMSITPREKKAISVEKSKEREKEVEKSFEDSITNILTTISKFKNNLSFKSINTRNENKNDKCISLYNLSKTPKRYKPKDNHDMDELKFTPVTQK